MSNHLPPDVINRIRLLRADGCSLRKIARELGISKNTVARYISGDDDARCKCGAVAGHRGWCKARYAESIARQAFHARRRGVFIAVPTQPQVSRVSEATQEKRMWLGSIPHENDRLPWHLWFGVIGEVRRETNRIPYEIRSDVQHEMMVAVMEGRLPRADIKRAVVTFIGYIMKSCCERGPDPRYEKPVEMDGLNVLAARRVEHTIQAGVSA